MRERLVGVMDIGANSIRLNMYEIENGVPKQLISKKNIAGLVSYREGNTLSEKGIFKLSKTVSNLLKIHQATGGDALYAFATASLRDLDNQEEVLEKTTAYTGLNIEVISQDDEARLGLCGMLSEYPNSEGIAVDIGGGSTELTCFREDKHKIVSLKDGSLSLYRKYVSGIIPTKKEIKEMKGYIENQLNEKAEKFETNHFIGIGGTVRACGNVIFELGYSESNNCFSIENLNFLYNGIKCGDEAVIKKILQVVPERIHTITPGVVILRCVLNYFDLQSVLVSKSGLREGFLLQAMRRDGDEQEQVSIYSK